jgi:hypothetical protein
MDDVHGDQAGLERVPIGHPLHRRLVRDEVIGPDPVVEELEALPPIVGPLGRRPVIGHG